MNADALSLSPALAAQVAQINATYMALVQQIAASEPCAPAILGVSAETTAAIASCGLRQMMPLIASGFLLAQPRLVDAAVWQRVAAGKADATQLIHAMLRTIGGQ